MAPLIQVVCVAILCLAGAATAHAQTAPPPPPPPPTSTAQGTAKPPVEDHSAHMAQAAKAKTTETKEPIPAVTDADRAAAFPAGLEGHAVHDNALHFHALFD